MKAFKILSNIFLSLLVGLMISQAVGTLDPVASAFVNPFVVGALLYAGSVTYHTLNLHTSGPLIRDITLTDTSYEGDILRQFISYSVTQFETLKKGCINVLGGIKKKRRVPTIAVENFIQARVETPNSNHSGDMEIDARLLEPQDLMGYLEFNPRDLESHAVSVELNPELLDAELPTTVESAVLQEILKLNGNYFDKAVWRSEKDAAAIATAKTNGLGTGDNNLIFFDGLQMKMYQDADVKKVVGPSAISPANIVSKFEAVAQDIPQEVYDDPAFKFLLAGKNRLSYRDAQKNQQYKGIDFTKGGNMEFDGRPVVSINGMSPNTLVGCKASLDMSSNLWLGVNEIDEDMYLKMMAIANNSEKWFIKMLYKLDVNYGLPKEIVAHMTETYD